jgi:hypothetical protein
MGVYPNSENNPESQPTGDSSLELSQSNAPKSLDLSEHDLLQAKIKSLEEGFSFYRKATWGVVLMAAGFAAKEVYSWVRWEGLTSNGPVPMVHNSLEIKEQCLPILLFHDEQGERVLELPLSRVDYYRSRPRQGGHFEKYVTPDEPIIRDLGRLLAAEKLTKEAAAQSIVDYVRGRIYYDQAEQYGQTGYVRYPVETLLGSGDCEDVAILVASLLRAAEIECVLLSYRTHVAVGIAGDFIGTSFTTDWDNKQYYFAECTSSKFAPGDYRPSPSMPIGECNSDYVDQKPTIIRLP